MAFAEIETVLDQVQLPAGMVTVSPDDAEFIAAEPLRPNMRWLVSSPHDSKTHDGHRYHYYDIRHVLNIAIVHLSHAHA
jgi:hypothetical protein